MLIVKKCAIICGINKEISLKGILIKRMLYMKSILTIFVSVVLLSLSACTQVMSTPLAAVEETKTLETPISEDDSGQPLVKTSIGDFVTGQRIRQ
jgi:hypothetical protein